MAFATQAYFLDQVYAIKQGTRENFNEQIKANVSVCFFCLHLHSFKFENKNERGRAEAKIVQTLIPNRVSEYQKDKDYYLCK